MTEPTNQPTNQPTDTPSTPATSVEAVGGVRLADGATARVLVAPVRITSLTVPMTSARAAVRPAVRNRSRFEPTPTLRGRTVVPTGPNPGGSTSGGVTTLRQLYPLLVWRWTHGFGRRPMVAVFQGLGADAELVDTDLDGTSSTEVVVTWAVPTVGSVELR